MPKSVISFGYRIQQLAYGGLKPETVARLEALGEELYGKGRRSPVLRRVRHQDKPVTGTRLIREALRQALRYVRRSSEIRRAASARYFPAFSARSLDIRWMGVERLMAATG